MCGRGGRGVEGYSDLRTGVASKAVARWDLSSDTGLLATGPACGPKLGLLPGSEHPEVPSTHRGNNPKLRSSGSALPQPCSLTVLWQETALPGEGSCQLPSRDSIGMPDCAHVKTGFNCCWHHWVSKVNQVLFSGLSGLLEQLAAEIGPPSSANRSQL